MSAILQNSAEAVALPALPGPARALATEAVQALLDEASLTPKPGLVDARGSGAHQDLDLGLMQRSACALAPGFARMAQVAALQPQATPALRAQLGAIGRDSEAAMFAVSAGVNTHRGAIWALGLLVAAAAQRPGDWQAQAIATRAAALARLADPALPAGSRKGAEACRRYRVGGARGEAELGFPHVLQVALPQLWRSRQRGDSERAARLDALLAVMARLDDTCVLSRGGRAGLAQVQHGARAVLASGGVASLAGRRALHQLDRELLQRRLSPGGAADLLAAALLLDRLQTVVATGVAPRWC